jgi:sporulation protein YlmC with PRC-barrel domain
MSAARPRLGRELLDHQIADAHGVLCGKVDDLRLVDEGDRLTVEAILCGPPALRRRLPRWLRATLGRALHGREVTVEWAAVERIGSVIALRADASAVGLGAADRRATRWVKRVPRS